MSNVRGFRGKRPQVEEGVFIDPTAVVIGDVTIGPGASIWPMCVVRGDIHRVAIGAQTNVQDGAVLHVSHDSRFRPGGAPLILHQRITVGHQAVLHGCEIKDLCLIGIGARVLDGAVLEPMTMLGAGSLVPPGQVLAGGYLWLGTPARRVRVLADQELEYLAYSADHYVRLGEEHRRALGEAGGRAC